MGKEFSSLKDLMDLSEKEVGMVVKGYGSAYEALDTVFNSYGVNGEFIWNLQDKSEERIKAILHSMEIKNEMVVEKLLCALKRCLKCKDRFSSVASDSRKRKLGGESGTVKSIVLIS